MRSEIITNLLSQLASEKEIVRKSQETRATMMANERTSVTRQQALVNALINEALPVLKNSYVSVELANGVVFGKLKNVTYENSSNVNVELLEAFLEGISHNTKSKTVVFYLETSRIISVPIENFLDMMSLNESSFLSKRNEVINLIINK